MTTSCLVRFVLLTLFVLLYSVPNVGVAHLA
jgi:hypothetical protein